MCEAVACSIVGQWKPLLEILYFASGVLLLGGVLLAWKGYRSTRQLAMYRNTIDKFATYRNERDAKQIARVRELIENGAFAGTEFVPGAIADIDRECVRFVLNEWEEIALCVKYKIYSEQVLFEHYGRLGLDLWKELRPYMRHEQKTQSSKWSEFDRLAVKWMIRTSDVRQEPALGRLRELTKELDRVLAELARP
ncbi:DUF4760 domain-containing protein [Variovorax sp. LjRoot175]|uniref:DUF4760 domain-containing protein n=1 Tax=Variovorax sp. LjRoot175 TaxID=3342276 RepID=UPI003ED16039